MRITREATQIKDAAGEIVRVLERATRTFVGTYFERDGEGLVRVDGTVFAHSISVGDPGRRGRSRRTRSSSRCCGSPSPDDRGEGVITEVLGPHGKPGVDTLSIIRAFGLPDAFPEARWTRRGRPRRRSARTTSHGREDFTDELVVTIDPPDARDFDDAVSVDHRPEDEALGADGPHRRRRRTSSKPGGASTPRPASGRPASTCRRRSSRCSRR